MALEIDLNTASEDAHQTFTYPEDDDALKQRILHVAERCMKAYERGGDLIEVSRELYGVTYELRQRGYHVSIDVEEELITVKPR